MKLAAWASAVVSIATVGRQFGWWHSLAATILLLGLWVTVNVIRHRAWMRARNGHDLTREKAHHAADSIITTMAAAIGTRAARDLALEASAILDDATAAGASAEDLMDEARALARRFPAQLRNRAKTKIHTPEVQAGAGGGAVDWGPKSRHWVIEAWGRSIQILALLDFLERAGCERVEWHYGDRWPQYVIFFTSAEPLTRDVISSTLAGTCVGDIYVDWAAEGEEAPQIAR